MSTDEGKNKEKEFIENSDNNIYTPVPVESFEFPVGAMLLDLSQRYMRMIRWHWHDEVEFIIIHSGIAQLKLQNESILLSPGEGAFINQSQLHAIYSYGNEDCSLYTLKFHPAFLFGYGQANLSAKYLTPVLSSPALHCLALRKEDPAATAILTLVHNSINCCLDKPYGYELAVKSFLCSLWNFLLPFSQTAAATSSQTNTQASLDSIRIKQALTFIEAKHMEPLTLDEIAASIHVSKSECCRCFQRSLGLTPFEYLMKYRIFESTRKIMRGDEAAKSISTLAASVGFNSASYYNKLFKKYLNCTPSEYKKSLQNVSTSYLP
ncbi:MAG: AraC family transcriptional regulator [Lachnospiraceae bacterium]